MYRGRRVAVVIPCHNESRFIARVIAGLPAWVDDVTVVDDASRDGTAAAAQALRDPRVHVIVRRRNGGVGAAVVQGYRAVLRRRAELVVVTNGDAQMSGAEVPELLRALCEGSADLCKGNRLGCPHTRRHIPWARRAGIEVLGRLTRVASGLPHVADAQSGYHAITADALRRLPLHDLWPRFGFPNDLILKASVAGLRVAQRPVRAIYGAEVSDLRWHHAVYPVGWLLLRGWWQRRSL